MISVKSASLRINNRRLLHEVSVDLHPGEVLAIVGPNGAGKSTLLKLIAGDLPVTSGRIIINKLEIGQWTRKSLATVRGVLPQHSSLNFPFTVEEIVWMGRIPHRQIPGGQSHKEIVNAAILAVQISHLKDRVFTSLSGGEQQRVQLARVLAQIWESTQQTQYLLLDEPTSALDLSHQHQVLNIARRLAVERSMGVLAVVHDLNLAACYTDRLAMMMDGQIKYMGKTAEVLSSDCIKEVFDIEAEVHQHQRLNFQNVIAIPRDNSLVG